MESQESVECSWWMALRRSALQRLHVATAKEVDWSRRKAWGTVPTSGDPQIVSTSASRVCLITSSVRPLYSPALISFSPYLYPFVAGIILSGLTSAEA